MKPTIKDVARLAGVSVGTASKVVNGEGRVGPELQAKVREAVSRLNYHPNAVARSLKSAHTRTVAVLLGDLTNPFQMTLAKGIEEVLYEHDYHLLICSTKENPQTERNNIRMLREKRVDGVIACTTGRANEELRELIGEGIPLVLVDRPVPPLPVDIVADDALKGMELLVRHLAGLGHRRIAAVHGDPGSLHGALRRDGMAKAMAGCGLELPPERQFAGGFTFEGGRQAVDAFFRLSEPPTAVVSANNNMTAGLLRACRDRGLRIPRDLSIVSFGGLEYTWNLITPSVTYVSQAPLTIGRKAAELVLRRLRKEAAEPARILLTPELIAGESSGSPGA